MEGYVDAYTKNEKDLFIELWDSNAVFEDPVGSDPCKGIEAIGNFWDFAHAEGMTITPSDVSYIVCGNEGILKAVMKVRNESNGTSMDISIVDHFVINDSGKIISGRAFWDQNSISSN